MTKKWKIADFDNCPECGDAAEYLTDCKNDGEFWDGDDVRCAAQCGATGNCSADGEGGGWISWCEDEIGKDANGN